jgi:hypothetical protein
MIDEWQRQLVLGVVAIPGSWQDFPTLTAQLVNYSKGMMSFL